MFVVSFIVIIEPKLIAPVVAYLCHESNTDNGAIIESAAGWATKVYTVRGNGAVLRSSLADDVTPEKVRDAWQNVTDMSKAERMNTITEASAGLMEILDKLESGNSASHSNSENKDSFKFANKDLILYALGGEFCSQKNLLGHNSIGFLLFVFNRSWGNRERFRQLKVFV